MDNSSDLSLLVSVIIPCYNHGQYLAEAIDSVLHQTWPMIEVIVVDDGSKDNTPAVSAQYPLVKYIYQPNQGLSAARNTGIRHSKGEFLVFLDADDWLYPDGIRYNVEQLRKHPEAAFVSGAHDKVDANKQFLSDQAMIVTSNHFCHLLEGNYIGMHATVLYRRSVFEQYKFDVSLKACEDYDLYLKIARDHPVIHHTTKIAAYRIHTTNMSGNVPNMLKNVLYVLKKNTEKLQSKAEKLAYKRGQQIWREYYTNVAYQSLQANQTVVLSTTQKEIEKMLLKYKPILYLRYWATKSLRLLKSL